MNLYCLAVTFNPAKTSIEEFIMVLERAENNLNFPN